MSALSTPIPLSPLDELPSRRRAFVEAYIKLMNATDAAQLAGYKSPDVAGSRLLTEVSVMRALSWAFDRHIKERFHSRVMSREEMLERLTIMARTDITEFLGEATLKNDDSSTRTVILPSIDLDKARANGKAFLIKTIKSGQWGLEITFHDCQVAMKMLARIAGFEAAQKLEVTGKNGGPVEIAPGYDLSALNDAELGQLKALLSKAKAGKGGLPAEQAEASSGAGAPVDFPTPTTIDADDA